MPLANQPPTESQILNRYLLQPSSLPTILPYRAFLALFPTTTRNDASLAKPLRKLYADLQAQRNDVLDSVKSNIRWECSKEGSVLAGLWREVAGEMDGGDDGQLVVDMKRERSVELELSGRRKRKRADDAEGTDDGDEDDDEAEQDANNHGTKRTTRSTSRRASSATFTSVPRRPGHPNPEEEADDDNDEDSEDQSALEEDDSDSVAESEHEVPESPASSPPLQEEEDIPIEHKDQLLDTAFHGPRGLALPTSYHQKAQPFHTRASLLSAMQSAIAALQTEISQANEEADGIMVEMKETVGGLSDLRYGKFANEGLASEVEEALKELTAAAAR
jgi:hypothetical protein